MVNLMEQVMLNIYAKDNASNVAGKIDSSFQGMASNISKAVSSMSSSMMNFDAVSGNMMQDLTGKSAIDNILGTSSKAETNKVLLNNMTETKKGAEDLYKTVDKVTDSSLTSMQELIPAMKAFKSATGASDKEMQNITDGMANFGSAVLAQTGSTDLAQGAMMDLSKGIKGAFAALDQYGITEESLKRTGYWNGDEKDVEGFMKAVTKVTGSTEELMETNQGLDALIGKSFSRAGKKMGNEFLPVIKDLKRGFLDLDDEMGGNLTASILAVSGGIEVMNQGLWNVSTTVNGVKDLAEAFHSVKDGASIALDTIKSFRNTTETVTSATQTASILSDVSPEAIQAAQAHAGGNLIKDNSSEYIQDMLDHQISSIDDADYRTALLEKKYEDLDIKSNRLNDVSTKTGKNLEKSQSKGLFSRFFKNTGETVESAAGVGALAPEATAASAGIEGTAVATTSISAAFTEMIVPLLAIAAVIAIMIPIAAGLAAEAMIFLKLLADFMTYLDFGSVDLKKSNDGIKEIAEALGWIGVAMAGLTLINVMTGLATMTSGFQGVTGPLKKATAALTEVSYELQTFTTTPVDKSVVENIKGISESLGYVSNAMLSLTGTNITMGFSNFVAWALNFGTVGEGLSQAKSSIENASSQLKDFNVAPLPKEQADNIQNVCNSLASVGDAMSALTSIRDSQNWDAIFTDLMTGLFGEGVDIQTALSNVQDDIQKASSALQNWTNLQDVPEGIGDKINKVLEVLKTISTTFETLRGLRDDSNWDSWMQGLFGGADISGALEIIKTDLTTVGQKLSELSGLADINEDITTKITNVGNGIKSVTEVMKSFSTLSGMGIATLDTNVIATAVTNVQNAATQLSNLNNTTFNGDTANSVLGSIKTSLENLKSTLSAASGFTAPAQSIGTQIIQGIHSGIAPLGTTVISGVNAGINSARNAANTGGITLAQQMTSGFQTNLKLNEVMTTEMGHVKSAVDNGINAAKTAAQNGAQEVVQAFKAGINVGSPGDIARTMSGEMSYTLAAIKDKYHDLKGASYNASRIIVDNFGNPTLNPISSWGTSQISSLGTINSNAPPSVSNGNNVTIIVQEGAIPVDARNKTTKEAKGMLTLALEGLEDINNIDVTGA